MECQKICQIEYQRICGIEYYTIYQIKYKKNIQVEYQIECFIKCPQMAGWLHGKSEKNMDDSHEGSPILGNLENDAL